MPWNTALAAATAADKELEDTADDELEDAADDELEDTAGGLLLDCVVDLRPRKRSGGLRVVHGGTPSAEMSFAAPPVMWSTKSDTERCGLCLSDAMAMAFNEGTNDS